MPHCSWASLGACFDQRDGEGGGVLGPDLDPKRICMLLLSPLHVRTPGWPAGARETSWGTGLSAHQAIRKQAADPFNAPANHRCTREPMGQNSQVPTDAQR